MEPSRRDFLRGLLVSTSVAAGTALVKLAEPGEVTALVTQREVVLGHPEQEFQYQGLSPEIYMRKGDGFICVGICTRMVVAASVVDATMAWNGEARYVPGLKRGEIFFEGRRKI